MRTLADLTALIERLEKAGGPSRELDAQIAYAVQLDRSDVHNREFVTVFERHGPEEMGRVADTWNIPKYTASIDAALTLVPEGWSKTIDEYADGRGVARCWGKAAPGEPFGRGPDTHHVEACTAPLALCIAALKARQTTEGDC